MSTKSNGTSVPPKRNLKIRKTQVPPKHPIVETSPPGMRPREDIETYVAMTMECLITYPKLDYPETFAYFEGQVVGLLWAIYPDMTIIAIHQFVDSWIIKATTGGQNDTSK